MMGGGGYGGGMGGGPDPQMLAMLLQRKQGMQGQPGQQMRPGGMQRPPTGLPGMGAQPMGGGLMGLGGARKI